MKRAKGIAALLLSSVVFLSGCSGFWDAPSDSGSTTTTTLTSGVFYVLNTATAQIVAYYVNAGTLTKIATYSTPTAPTALTVAPSNKFLYLATVGGIYVYSIASTGELNSGTSISTDQAYTLQVDSTNQWLLEAIPGVAVSSSGSLCAIPLSTSTGLNSTSTGLNSSPTEQCLTLPGSSTSQLAISQKSSGTNYVFVAMGSAGTEVIPFTAASSTPFGSGINIGVARTSGSAKSVAIDPSNRLFYIGETVATSGSNSGGLRAFLFNSLPSTAELSGSPYASGGLAPYSILPENSGDFVYVANRQTASGTTGVIKGFTISSSSSTYTLTALGDTFSAGTHTVALAEDSTHKFIFAVNIDGGYDLTGYVFDSTNAGDLDTVVQASTGTDPVSAGAIAAAH